MQDFIKGKQIYQVIRFGTQLLGLFLACLFLTVWVYYFNILFVAGAMLLAFFFGRVFCGWFCPNGMWADKVVSFLSRNKPLPKFFKLSYSGIFLLSLF